MEDVNDDGVNESILSDDIGNDILRPRVPLSRTNWLYRLDALRVHDKLEMQRLLQISANCISLLPHLFSMVSSLDLFVLSPLDRDHIAKLEMLHDEVMNRIKECFRIGYSSLVQYVNIAFYPSSNRNNGRTNQHRYPPIKRRSIDDLSISESREMTGLSINQLKKLYIHLRIPPLLIWKRRYSFDGEEAFLHFMLYLRCGESKLRMSTSYFGGDPRRFTYSVRLIIDHLYHHFYHKISGDSMQMWVDQIKDFRNSIWKKLTQGYTIESTTDTQGTVHQTVTNVSLEIPPSSFRIFGFLDDTGFRTQAPARTLRRRYGLTQDVQRAFYSGYFSGHGLKVQAVTLPNGLFGSIFVSSLRISDCGLQNMSGLDSYLSTLFRDHDLQIADANNQLPALYADGVFPNLATIVARFSNGTERQQRINTRMSSVRQSIEHLFALHHQTFALFTIPNRLKLLLNGRYVSKMVLMSFFMLNCFTCFNEVGYFEIRPPTIEEYLSLDEELMPPPDANSNYENRYY